MALIRTPEERFANLPGFPYRPHYVEINGARVHYVDEGQGEMILCLHGEPSWSYLYRKMIPVFSQNYRVIAPDFIGFGKSDKFTEEADYSIKMHIDTLMAFIDRLSLNNITVVVQDWGGLIGLCVVSLMPERFSRLVIMNTGLPDGEQKMSQGFKDWLQLVENTPDLPIAELVRKRCYQKEQFTQEILKAYDAPFPDVSYKAGAHKWPLLVPISPDYPGAEFMKKAREELSKWQKPALVLFSDQDPITRGGERFFRRLIPGCKGEPEITIKDADHFLQEDKGEEVATLIVDFIGRNPIN